MGIFEKFTGEDVYNIADEKYKKTQNEYYNRYLSYRWNVDNNEREIKELIESINEVKINITENLFRKMKVILSKTKYDRKINLEHIKIRREKIEAEQVSKKEKLFTIDFHTNPILTNFEAVFTLGFSTRKKAQESLDNVEIEEKKIQEIFTKMDANIKRMEKIIAILKQLFDCLKDMVAAYEIILYKADNATKYLRYKTMQFTHITSQSHYKLSILPKADQELLFALFHFSVLLYRIVKRNWLGNSDEEVLENNKALISLNKKYEIVKAKYAA